MLGAAIGAAGALLSGGLNYFGQKSANKANVSSARESMDLQERMSSTSYQRSMEDMRKAGLNPILAAGRGGASPVGGATSQSQNELSGAVSSALDTKRMLADIAKIKEDTVLTRFLQDKTRADIANSALATASQVRYQNALGDNADSQSLLNLASASNVRQNMVLKSPMAPVAGAANRLTEGAVNVFSRIPGFFSSLKAEAEANYKRQHPDYVRKYK